MILDQATLKQLLDYDPDTGSFIWKERPGQPSWNARYANKPAGHVWIDPQRPVKRYLVIHIKRSGRVQKAHRLAWLYVTGSWPDHQIDHVDCDGLNNRFSNLRAATHAQNARNARTRRDSATGIKGVHAARGRYYAHIRHDGRQIHLGTFATAETAHAAYCRASAELHGEFGRVE